MTECEFPRRAGDTIVGPPGGLARLSAHGADADTVELKTLLAVPARRAASALIGHGRRRWRLRRLYLFDTTTLDFARAGVEMRLRCLAGGGRHLSVRTRRSGVGHRRGPEGARVELDVLAGVVWHTVELRREIDPTVAAEVIAGGAAPGEVLSNPQRDWACRGGSRPMDDVGFADLVAHGPLAIKRVKVAHEDSGLRRAHLEHCAYPSGRELVEFSARCRPDELTATARVVTRLLIERDLAAAETQHTKSSIWQDEILRAVATR